MPVSDLLRTCTFQACKPSLAALGFICTALLSGCGGGSDAAPGTPSVNSTTTLNGATQSSALVLSYNSFLPEAYARETDKRWPLIISLHGAGGLNSSDNLIDVHARHTAGFGFIVVAPSSGGRTWSVASLERFYTDVIARYRIDPERVYLTGLSMGSYGAWEFAQANPRRFAALALISGGRGTGDPCALKHLPVWLFHNRNDPVVPASRSIATADALSTCGATPKLTIYDAPPDSVWEHNAWLAAWTTPQLYEWFLANPRVPAP